MPIKIALHCMHEICNCKVIYQGILHASKIFPNSYIIMAFIGIVKGNGPGFIRLIERLIRGSWSLNVLEFMNPSYTTKLSTIATIIFIVNRHSEWFMISQPFVFFCVVSFCTYFRISAIMFDLNNPFSPIENIICLIIFGGIWDALARAIAIDEHSQRLQTSKLRARAMKVDMLSKEGTLVIEKSKLLSPQMAKY